MKKYLLLVAFIFTAYAATFAQDKPVGPSFIGVGQFHGLSQPLRDAPVLTDEEWQKMEVDAMKPRNEGLKDRSYPFEAIAFPKGADEAWQKDNGKTQPPRAPIVNFNGQTSPYYPSDCNGTAGPNHYMQTINCVYAIYNKTGTLVAGPSNMNTLFSGVTGATYNDGDPVILYDEMADRWVACEFSISGSNDYMLMAVSQTNDPTGSWYRYSFDVDDMPDYEKMSIWPDGYYMGTNNSSAGKKDIYVFQRSQMLTGGTAQYLGFDNAWRPTTVDGFMCVPPVDNDGVAAPTGNPGLFITINDDAIAGGSDQLWIYQLAVNWTTPSSSTFVRSQQLGVTAFDSNFGSNWDNIKQPNSQELDAIPQVIMNAPQYRNFGSYHTLVCCHTVDVDNTDHAGVRWYELRSTDGRTWTVRQTGTYAPDAHSRWMASIRLNGQNEIGLGYSISSSTVYPGIRYTGQSATAYAAGAGVMDLAEQTIVSATTAQSTYNRWGDYAGMSVDPSDDKTFWFTTQYGGSRQSKIASFQVAAAPATPDLIVQSPAASPTSVLQGATTTASCTVKNQGGAAAGASTLKYFLSSNTTYSADDVLLASDAVAALAAGSTAAVSEVVTIPSATTVGIYYVLFYADADAAVTEGNETN
ncbi:MAG TPA: CARDB domain-containing protein, partial [Bacteroidales bacterium]|nr:CARDB domain-containing protein [Bacteroidales bacterium]